MDDIRSAESVRALFDEMARTYGVVNLVSSLGFAYFWRRSCVAAVRGEAATVCDLMAGGAHDEAMRIIERELGRPLAELYAEIEAEPVAAASLGQVYRARMHSGETVAVKVQRPGLDKTINFDLATRPNTRISGQPSPLKSWT